MQLLACSQRHWSIETFVAAKIRKATNNIQPPPDFPCAITYAEDAKPVHIIMATSASAIRSDRIPIPLSLEVRR